MGQKTFNQTFEQIAYGEAHDEATKLLNHVVEACDRTGKAGTITIKLSFKPNGTGQMAVAHETKVALPKEVIPSTVMFVTPENNLQREDPRQRSIEGLKTVDQELRTPRKVG